jgi:hypothetical protein
MNELQGHAKLTLDGTQHQLKFGMNTYRIMLKNMGISLSEMGSAFEKQGIEVIFQLVFAAIRHNCDKKGEEMPFSYEKMCALFDDVQSDEMASLMKAFQSSGELMGNLTAGAGPAREES